jgi:transcriptional regulator with XRE-family HTH domain
MEIKDRIYIIIKDNHLSPSSFADKINANRSSISHVLSGRNKPSLDLLEKIVLNFPNVNSYWLLTGVTNVNPVNSILKQEDVIYDKDKIKSIVNRKEIVKIVEFYNDNTYSIYYPSEE